MLDEIIEMIADFKDLDPKDVDPDCNLMRDVGFTSFQVITLVSEIEGLFDMDIPVQVLRNFTTPRRIYEYIVANYSDHR